MRRVLLAVGAHTNTCIMLCEFPNRSSVPGGKKRSGILPTHTTVAIPSVRALIAKLGVDSVGCEQTQATCEEQRRARMREWGCASPDRTFARPDRTFARRFTIALAFDFLASQRSR